jgi:hypothetical protein
MARKMLLTRALTRQEVSMATLQSHIDENLAKLEAKLDLWGAKLKEVIARTNVAGKEAKIESQKEVEELKSNLEIARSKLAEAKAAGSEKWDSFKDGVEHLWQDLEGRFKKLVH